MMNFNNFDKNYVLYNKFTQFQIQNSELHNKIAYFVIISETIPANVNVSV